MPGLRTLVVILALPLAACSGGAVSNEAATTALTGLYEGGEGPRRNRLCLIEREGDRAAFGFILWGRGDANCSASGSARRDGDRLRLLPDGDDGCALEARIDGGRISLSGNVSTECARYYCGPGGELGNATFARVGDDVAQARDLAGASLCGD